MVPTFGNVLWIVIGVIEVFLVTVRLLLPPVKQEGSRSPVAASHNGSILSIFPFRTNSTPPSRPIYERFCLVSARE